MLLDLAECVSNQRQLRVVVCKKNSARWLRKMTAGSLGGVSSISS